MSRRLLRATLTMFGLIATGAGAHGMIRGASEVIDAGAFSPNVDSEYRFYATWYHLAGIVLLYKAREPESAETVVRAIAAGLFGAACARVLSLRTVGTPHRHQRFLMAAEFAIPIVIVPWQARVARAAGQRPR